MDLKQRKITKLLGAILGIVLFIALVAGISYAALVWQSEKINIHGDSTCFIINYTKGQNIKKADMLLFDEKEIIADGQIVIEDGMAVLPLTAGLDSSCNIIAALNITAVVEELNEAYIENGDSMGALKYIIANYDPSEYSNISLDEIINNRFDIITRGSISTDGEIPLLNDMLSEDTKGYLVIFYIDGDLAQNDAQNSTFSVNITAVARQTIS